MIRLKNINIKNGIAEADLFPEDEGNGDHIVVNLSNEEVISLTNSDRYKNTTYIGHAIDELVRIYKNNDTRKESYTMWY